MKVYFTASTTGNGKFKTQYQEIVELVKKSGHELLSGWQIISPKLLASDKKLTREEIFNREKKAVERADFLVAEVSEPSTGVGGEIAYGLSLEKPVLALFYQEAKDRISPMLLGNPSDNLYLEHYDDDNLELKLGNFFKHVEVLKNRQGKLIVIDGGDGSGKATQSELLMEYFKKKGVPVKYVDFPRYYSSFHGKVVGRYLKGEFGGVEISPYLVSLAYAIDRAGTKEEINNWLLRGGIVLANRYTPSSLAYMSAKIKKGEEREEFGRWLEELEYRIHRMPKEDILLYLDVPPRIGQQLVEQKGERGYVGKKKDIHEANLKYLEEVEKIYLSFIKKKKNWVLINCCENGKIFSKEKINREILKVLKEKEII